MIQINIEWDKKRKSASYTIRGENVEEHSVKGIKAENFDDIFPWIKLWYARVCESDILIKSTAKYAGYTEIAEAVSQIEVGKEFTTSDVAEKIVSKNSPKFSQTRANISSLFSLIPKTKVDWITVVGKRGRSRIYRKTKGLSIQDLEKRLRALLTSST